MLSLIAVTVCEVIRIHGNDLFRSPYFRSIQIVRLKEFCKNVFPPIDLTKDALASLS